MGSNDIKEKYDELKLDYFHYLNNTRKESKGDIRTFIGLKVWEVERERLSSGTDKRKAHVIGLEEALDDYTTSMATHSFQSKLKRLQKQWRSNDQRLEREKGGDPLAPPPITSKDEWSSNGYNVVSLFSGALGLDLGFLASGFNLVYTNDIEKNACKTIERNLPGVYCECGDFCKVDEDELLKNAGIKKDEVDVLVGGPPCQPFSTAGKREGLNDPRASPLKDFIKAIKKLRPKVFVMEEVPGLKSARLKHVPISERGRKLQPEEKKGSVFGVIEDMFEETGYNFRYQKLQAASYGSPQNRERLIFIGVRDERDLFFPTETHSHGRQKKLGQELRPRNTFWDSVMDIQGDDSVGVSFSDTRKNFMEKVPPAGHWRHLPESVIEEAMGGAYNSGGGRMGYFRRLSWDEPTPTLLTSPTQKASTLCHPEEPRPLSLQEYKRIQGFPDDWELIGTIRDKYRMVGNAVPVHLSYAIAQAVEEILGRD